MAIMHPDDSVTEDMKSAIAQGYYFEQCLTGKAPTFYEEPQHAAYMSYLDRAHEKTLIRLQDYAAKLRDKYIGDTPFNTGIKRTYECPEFVLTGELDLSLAFSEGKRKILDIKLIRNVNDTLSPDGRLFTLAYMIQPPTYALLDCIYQSESPDSLYAAAKAYLDKDFVAAMELMNEFMEGVVIPECGFLACEPGDSGYQYDVVTMEHSWGMPLHQEYMISLDSSDLLTVYAAYLSAAREIKTLVISGNEYMPMLASKVDANERRCLGKNVQGKYGGYCPYVSRCAYAQKSLFGTKKINFDDLWNSN